MFEAKVFDHADYESRLACNHELMVLVAGEFIKEASGLLDTLKAYMCNKDWQNVALVAHRLKGAGLEVSANRFCRLIDEVEERAAQHKNDVFPKQFNVLLVEFEALVLALNQHILR
jgi:HPt (histidine-containing phosphotransfer) domain-containing protein